MPSHQLRSESHLPRYRCPACHNKTEGLWEGVEIPGRRAIDAQLKPEHGGAIEREADWHDARPDGTYGCACGWEGRKGDLERIDRNGELLPTVHPQQTTLDAGLLGKPLAWQDRSWGHR